MNVTRMFGSLQWECIKPAQHWRFDDGWGEFSLQWHEAGGRREEYRGQYVGWYLHTPEGPGEKPLSTRLTEAARLVQDVVLNFRPRPVDKPRRDRAVEDYLKSEELYAPVLKVMLSLDPADMTYSSLEEARGLLDRILNQGKIIGRRTAVGLGNRVVDPDNDALIEGWQRCVDSK